MIGSGTVTVHQVKTTHATGVSVGNKAIYLKEMITSILTAILVVI